jgi:hypothetical protein
VSQIESGSDTITFSKATLIPELTKKDVGKDVETRVYVIGKINKGEYKGNILLAGRSIYISKIDQTDIDNSSQGIISDVYYIADSKYKPLAWDSKFYIPYEWRDDPLDTASAQIGLSRTTNKDLSAILPNEFSNFPLIKIGGYDFSLISSWFTSNLIATSTTKQIATTPNGYSILKYDGGELPDKYYVLLPTDFLLRIYPGHVEVNSNISWSKGTVSTSSYVYESINPGTLKNCFEDRLVKKLRQLVTQAGTTDTGDPLYILDFDKYANIYKCMHEEYNQYRPKLSYIDFMNSHPLLFWRHPVIDSLIPIVRPGINDPAVEM